MRKLKIEWIVSRILVVVLIFQLGCDLPNPKNKRNKINVKHNYIVLLDLSDRLIVQNNQPERDKEIIKVLLKEEDMGEDFFDTQLSDVESDTESDEEKKEREQIRQYPEFKIENFQYEVQECPLEIIKSGVKVGAKVLINGKHLMKIYKSGRSEKETEWNIYGQAYNLVPVLKGG